MKIETKFDNERNVFEVMLFEDGITTPIYHNGSVRVGELEKEVLAATKLYFNQ